MKKSLFFLLALLQLSVCAGAQNEGRVTILHTNDMHAQFVPLPATWIDSDPQPLIGGMVALEVAVRQARATFPHVLLLDAGDISTGTLLSRIDYNGALNGGFVEMMNLIGYDACTIGNHEFDDGQINLATLIDLARFDVLSANLLIHNKLFAPHAYKIYNIGKIRVGVIGLILTDLFSVAAKKQLENVIVADPVTTAQKIIDKIDHETDLIILLTHQGDDQDIKLAQRIQNADIIVGGHSHTRINSARQENGMLIVQAGSKTRYLGRLTVDVKGDTVASFDSELIPTWVDSVAEPHPEMVALVDKFQMHITAEYGQQIGTLKTAWKSHNQYETNLGNFLTDVMRDYGASDFALLNSGGIRKSLPAGPITKMDIMEILPFTNYLTTFACSGSLLADILQNDLKGALNNGYGLFQISGINYAYQIDADGSAHIVSIAIAGQPIDHQKIYTGTTVDFVVNNLQDHYQLKNITYSPDIIADIVIESIAKNSIIESRVEGRIRRVR
ncbi:5'-nucleotidase C-terminal domain-containing protein [candidate division KSB1 bacterium]|nr:5'-nucleotidase C-terminal domain-containing protein [candidate division KSB1 bacterium]